MNRILVGDVTERLRELPDESVQCVVTSPPYWGLRDYGVVGQLGLERTPNLYISKMVDVFAEVKRALRKDGTLWVNMGDSYNGQGARSPSIQGNGDLSYRAGGRAIDVPGLKPKDLCGIPWMLAFALRADGWYLRSDIIWHKPNPMPESVTDRPTKSHEYLFLLSKSERYFYDAAAIQEESITNDIRRPYGSQGAWEMDGRPGEQRHGGEPRSFKGSKFNTGKTAVHQLSRSSDKERMHGNLPGRSDNGAACNKPGQEFRNKRSVWTIATQSFSEAHFATFPEELIQPCILAGSKEGDTVLDPFSGAGTTGLVAMRYRRNFIGIELNPDYARMAEKRIVNDAPMFNEVTLS